MPAASSVPAVLPYIRRAVPIGSGFSMSIGGQWFLGDIVGVVGRVHSVTVTARGIALTSDGGELL